MMSDREDDIFITPNVFKPVNSDEETNDVFDELLSIGDNTFDEMDKYIAESPVEGVKNTSIYTNTFSDISDDELISSCERLEKLADNYQQLDDKSRKRRFAKPVNDIEVTEKGGKRGYYMIL